MAKLLFIPTLIVQQPPVFLSLVDSTALAVSLIGQAAQGGARLVVFPETWLPGYPVWLDHAPGAALWNHGPAIALARHMFENAPEANGPELAELAGAAAEHGVDVVLGLNERAGRTIYNATAYIGRDGAVRVRRKLMPTYNEKLLYGQGEGGMLDVWTTPDAVIGSLICWEHWMPLARAAMHDQGETVHVAQWPAVGELHQIASRHYAFEGQCTVIAAGTVLSRADMLDGYARSDGPADGRAMLESIAMDLPLIKDGGSAVIASDGSYGLAPVYGSAKLLFVDVPLPAYSPTLDTTGHYSRPDLFTLQVHRK